MDCTSIKVGDWAWVEDRWGQREYAPREVTKITKTLVVFNEGDEYDRFRRATGFAWDKFYNSRIAAVATAEEIENIGIPRNAARVAEKLRRVHVEAIQALFGNRQKEVYPINSDSELWSVKLLNLTEAEVRKCAEALKG